MFTRDFSGDSMSSNFTVPLLYIYPPSYLMQYDWLVPSMRLQVIQDSLFSRLGSGPFSGRGKRESQNRTKKRFVATEFSLLCLLIHVNIRIFVVFSFSLCLQLLFLINITKGASISQVVYFFKMSS